MLSSLVTRAVQSPAITAHRGPPADLPAPRAGSCNLGTVRRPVKASLALWRCHALSKPSTQDYSSGCIQNGLPVIKWPNKSPESDDTDGLVEIPEAADIPRIIHEIKAMLASMGDGEISVSPYDTAWVALVRDTNGNGGPQFPSSLRWIADNQLPDGSWGEDVVFSAHDRMINTLACVIALKTWSTCPEKCERGLAFLCENMWRLGEEDATLMPIGFEVAFPSLVEIAKELGLEIPYDDPALQDIYATRNLKLKRIPREVMHKVPTTLLHSLEGMPDLDWEKLLGLQSSDGSFLFSPSSTAYALEQTGDENCLSYLQRAVERFNGGVPNVYPVDLFEHLWAVDRLERLGVSRYFETEIKECMDYVHRYWTEDGICWARNSTVQDVDDTAMGFRLLRLHGYDVSTDVFRNFEKDDEFFCFAGQSNQAVTGMYNLNRASQVMFSGEEIMERAKRFSYRFLREKQASSQLMDKWIITKDLPGEVEYALDFPWYASLPRVETRFYVEQYGGADDVWIGKTLYRMGYVNNDLYLGLAKSDFNQCQSVHQLEWLGLQRWYEESGLGGHGVSRKSVLRAYFLATSCIFEPERVAERVGWAQAAVLAEAISAELRRGSCTGEFIRGFLNGCTTRLDQKGTGEGLVRPLLQHIELLSPSDGHHHQQQLRRRRQRARHHLRQAWKEWLQAWTSEDGDATGLLLVRTVEACGGRGEPVGHLVYARLAWLTSTVCRRLSDQMQVNKESSGITSDKTINSDMQELARCVLQSSDGLSIATKQTFLNVARSYYYAAHCSPTTLNSHIDKVLFERVV